MTTELPDNAIDCGVQDIEQPIRPPAGTEAGPYRVYLVPAVPEQPTLVERMTQRFMRTDGVEADDIADMQTVIDEFHLVSLDESDAPLVPLHPHVIDQLVQRAVAETTIAFSTVAASVRRALESVGLPQAVTSAPYDVMAQGGTITKPDPSMQAWNGPVVGPENVHRTEATA